MSNIAVERALCSHTRRFLKTQCFTIDTMLYYYILQINIAKSQKVLMPVQGRSLGVWSRARKVGGGQLAIRDRSFRYKTQHFKSSALLCLQAQVHNLGWLRYLGGTGSGRHV
jgi:hypothetical protein